MMHWFNTLWLAKTEGADRGLIHQDLAAFLLSERGGILSEKSEASALALKDSDKACKRIAEALDKQEKIFIHGDYDVDGLSSTALLASFLRGLGAEVETFIPHRLDDGYGLNEGGIEAALNAKTDLLITVDCGIRSAAEVEELSALGIDVIITDHHEPGSELPEACAVIDPKRADDPYPFKDLAGAGVAYMLVLDLCSWLRLGEADLSEAEALAMLGTVADVMPLLGLNRSLVLKGLAALKQGALPGISLMLAEADKKLEDLRVKDLAFVICPRLNAAGRMGDAGPAYRILESRDPEEMHDLALKLGKINQQRRDSEHEAMAEIDAMIEKHPEELAMPILLFRGRDIHPGVLGIVAARIREKYRKPAIVFTPAGDVSPEDGTLLLKGSGRTEGDFDLLACLEEAKPALESYGGHVAACGLTIREDRFEEAKALLITAAAEQQFLLNEKIPAQHVDYVSYYDSICSAGVLNMDEYEALSQLEPFGSGNEEPLCLFTDLEILSIRLIGRDKTHLRLSVIAPEGPVNAIAFGMADYAEWLKPGDRVTLAGLIQINEWQGKKYLQIMVQDILLPAEDRRMVPALAAESEAPDKKVLKPSDLVDYWKTLDKVLGRDSYNILSLERMRNLLYNMNNCRYSLKQVESMHRIFEEAGLTKRRGILNSNTLILQRGLSRAKMKLSDTSAWHELLREGGLEL